MAVLRDLLGARGMDGDNFLDTRAFSGARGRVADKSVTTKSFSMCSLTV
jgi:hypothetical protein